MPSPRRHPSSPSFLIFCLFLFLYFNYTKKGMKYFGENGVKFSPLTVAVLGCRREGGASGHAAWCPLVLREAGKREKGLIGPST